MTEEQKRNAIALAKESIQERASKGQVKTALVEELGLKSNEAGRIIRTAVRELYDSENKDPFYWLAQDCGQSTPLQRRFARRKREKLMEDPEVAQHMAYMSRAA